jgi:hypothetical protein
MMLSVLRLYSIDNNKLINTEKLAEYKFAGETEGLIKSTHATSSTTNPT